MLIITSFLLASCAGTSPDANKPKVRKSLSEQLQDNLAASIANVPPSLMGNGPGTQQATQLTASTQEEMLASADSGAVFFTDPYNSDASIPGLDEAFTRKKENQRWIQSYSSALREAQRTGYPILIWFHHSKGSPPAGNWLRTCSTRGSSRNGPRKILSASAMTRRKNLKASRTPKSAVG